MNKKQFLLCKKLFGCIKHHQLLNEYVLHTKKQKSCVKRIHLVTDDGLYGQKAFYTAKIVFIHPLWMMANLLTLLLFLLLIDEVEGNLNRQIKNRTFWVALSSRKKDVIRELFPPNCIFLYISSWSKVLKFYLMSLFNMKSRSVKFRNFLDDFPVHYTALFINRTNNNNYITLLMALHHTGDGFWHFS